MSLSPRQARLAIILVAAAVLLILLALRLAGADPMLSRILAIAGALLVTALFLTYRALLAIAASARAEATRPPASGKDP